MSEDMQEALRIDSEERARWDRFKQWEELNKEFGATDQSNAVPQEQASQVHREVGVLTADDPAGAAPTEPPAGGTKGAGQFPKPSSRIGKDPCGECHLQPGERCDICGAVADIDPRNCV